MTDPIANAETGQAPINQGGHVDLRDAIVSECTKVCFQSLIDIYGLEKMVRMIGAHSKHSGMAMANNARKRFGFVGDGLEQLATPFHWLHSGLSGGKIQVKLYRKGAVIELIDCPLKASHPGLCVASSHFLGYGICEVINPAYEYVFTHHLTNGDSYCRAVIREKDTKADIDDLGELVKMVPSLDLSRDETAFLRSSTIGEIFIICTKVLLENRGKDILADLLVPRMTMAGREMGEKLKKEMDSNKGSELDPDGLASLLVETFDLKISGKVRSDQELSYQVNDCPFKTAPPEVCVQLIAFLDGMFNALGCGYECHEKMSEGADECRCSVHSQLSRTNKEVNRSEKHERSRLDILKDRLAKGEITIEEYKAIRELV